MQNLILLALGMFVLGMDAYVIAGLLPAIGQSLHVNISEVGQAVSVFTLCYALSAPIFATLLAGKPMRGLLVFSLFIFTLGNAFSVFATSLSCLLVARAVAGVGAGIFSPLAVAAAINLVSKERRGRALSVTLGGMSAGTVVGVPLGLFLAHYLGWQGTLGLITLLGLFGLTMLFIKFPNMAASMPPSFRERMGLLVDVRVAMTVSITFLTGVASLGLYTYIAVILSQADIQNLTPYLWAWGIGGLIGSFSIGNLIDLTKQPRYLTACILLIMSISMLVLPSALNFFLIGLSAFMIWGAVGWASLAPQQHALIALKPRHSAAVVALNSSANYLGSAVGAALGGYALFLGVLPMQLPLIAGVIALLALFGHMFLMIKNKAVVSI